MEQEGLLQVNNVHCPNCACILKLQKDSARKSDGYRLVCIDCGKKLTIRHNSFFEGHRMEITTILRIIHLLRQKVPMKFIQDDSGASQSAIHAIYVEIAEKVSRFMYQNKPIFDPVDIIECDETVEPWAFDSIPTYATNIVTRTGEWVFVMRARHSNKVWLEPVRQIYI